uniref:Beta-galactosidase n=1 Tax=Anaerolinea thermolimosa TaxID=229919 RepID=A0A7C4PNZ6_9CHLR
MHVLRFRQVHLDFHTSEHIPGVGSEFNADEFVDTLKRAHVNSVTLFSRCHHGWIYHETRFLNKHPHLTCDLLALQIEACHRHDIRCPIYITVGWDEYMARQHPEWLEVDANGKRSGPPPLQPGWHKLCFASPYIDYVIEQTDEVLQRFGDEVDGIFFDMCWDQPSLNNYFVEAMLRRDLNPEIEADRNRYARMLALDYMRRFHRLVKDSSPAATVFFNCRPFFNLAEDIAFQEQVEIEALPTGGWGYIYFPKNVRYARTFGKPYMGMTGRFHKSWADFGGLKPYPALEYETSQMIAHGARCSVGDQLHPRGVPDKAVYELIGRAYARVEALEPWLIDATPVSQIGLFQAPTGVLSTTQSTSGTDEGATRVLTQLRHQFDVVSADSRLENYDLLILPDRITLDEPLTRRLRAFLKRGGRLLASGASALSPAGDRALLPELGVKPEGPSPYSCTYLRFEKVIARDVPDSDHIVYDRGVRVRPAAGTQTLARVVEPYFERSWRHFSSHKQTPGDRVSPYAAATLRGPCAYIHFPVFSAIAQHGNYPYRLLVRNILELLLPEPLIRVGGPTGLEATVARQAKPARTIVHLLYYAPERRAHNLDLIEDIVPLYDLPVSLKHPRKPRKVYLAPDQTPIAFEYLAGRVNFRLSELRGHQAIVVE